VIVSVVGKAAVRGSEKCRDRARVRNGGTGEVHNGKCRFSAVHFPTVSDAEDSHAFVSIINFVDYPVLADTDAPVVTRAG
jgi:hypothetical protein